MGQDVLLLRDGARTAFVCGIDGWPQDAEEKQQWQSLVTAAVEYAFVSRPVTVVTLTPMTWSVAHTLPDPRELRTEDDHFLVNRVARFSGDLLSTVVQSEDFQRGLLWLLARMPGEETELLAVLERIDVTQSPSTPATEALFLLDDGRRLDWLHPGRDVEGLEAKLSEAIHDLGWRVSKQSTGGGGR